nr:group II intron maturase-specific domain-containing protein [Pseudomonas putida]
MSLGRLRDRLAELLRRARGHKMANVIERINPVLRGWRATSSSARASGHLRNWMAGSDTNFAAPSDANGSGPLRGLAA